MKNAAEVARKWTRNLSQATESIKQGVQAVTENPAEKAAARADAYAAGVQRAVTEGRYQRGLRKVTLADWQNAMLNKGLQRVAAGAANATPKVTAFMEKFLPHQEQLKAKLRSMPRGDLQTNIARAIAAIEHNAQFRMS